MSFLILVSHAGRAGEHFVREEADSEGQDQPEDGKLTVPEFGSVALHVFVIIILVLVKNRLHNFTGLIATALITKLL